MPSIKVKNIYMAKSLDQLMKKAEETKNKLTVPEIKSNTKSLVKLYTEGKNSIKSGDEERSYVLFYRFIDLFQFMNNSKVIEKDPKYFDSMIGNNKVLEVMKDLENLTESMQKRYLALKESEELRAKEIADSCDKQMTNSNDLVKSKTINLNDNLYPIIDCITLLECIESSTEITKILILDTRKGNEYNESHIHKLKSTGDITIANIPENILTPGLSAAKLESILALGHSRDAYSQRRKMNKVVIIDKFSQEFIANTPAFILAEALWKWDCSSFKIKSMPFLLKGGYSQWIITYPMYTTNANVLNKDTTISLKQINLSFNYEFKEEEDNEHKNMNNHVVNGLLNGETNDLETNEPVITSRFDNIFQPRPTNTAIPGTALPLIPDRSMKPKLQIEDKNSTKQKTSEGIEDLEKIKLRKQAEATEEMLTVYRQGYEDTVKDYEQQLKKKDEQNAALRKLIPEKPKMIVNSNEKMNVSSVIKINGDFSDSDEKENNETQYKTQIIINGDVNHNLNNDKSNKLFKNSVKSSNSLSINNSNLSRSLSSPNIAQLLEKEDVEMDDIEQNNTKSRSLTNPLQPQFDRNLKPLINREKFNFHESSVITDNKLRDFSPVYSTSSTITGLKNLGNTCFMNAVIQCLLNTPQFASYFRGNFNINRGTKFGSNGELALELAFLFRTITFPSNYKSISPKDLKNAVNKHIRGFIGCNQQDSHEFLVKLLERLHEDLNESNVSNTIDTSIPEDLSLTTAANKFWKDHLLRNKSILTELFEGLLVHTLTCLTCHKTSNSFEVFSHLSLPLTNYRTNLNDCLGHFLKTERMSGETAWECPVCKQKREADKKVAIWKLPKVLIVHLKRFSYEGVWRQKLQTYVEFPIKDLSLRSFNANESHYSLYGVVNHYGTLEGGHYTAFSRLDNKYDWHRFDDSEVTQINSADVKTQAAYILFYKLS